MSIRRTQWLTCRRLLSAVLVVACALAAPRAQAQFLSQQVGGVWIDADGLVTTIQTDRLNDLRRQRADAFRAAPADLQAKGLRKISLRRLEEAIAAHPDDNTPLPEDIRYLGGLQQLQYVFVYPEQRDIVIAGPAEGWKLNALGEVVGVTTNRPVLLLDDLLVALRSIQGAQATGILCSIDPTNEGLARSAALMKRLTNPGNNINPVLAQLEQAVGPQTITVKGVPDTSHFAAVLVAADYGMKRIAMGFEQSPVRSLPSYLQMIKSSGKRAAGVFPRWWLEPRYEAILADADGLAYELRGSSVKCMTEDQALDAGGQRRASGKTDPLAKKWSDLMTAHYDELSQKDAVFGQLRNCVDMAVLAALVMKENLTAKAGWSMPVLLDAQQAPVMRFHAPHQVDSQASAVEARGRWIISVSGGVMINPWQPVAQTRPSAELGAVRREVAEPPKGWHWD